MNNDILKLSACQALFMSSTSIVITTSAMIGASLSEHAQYATMGVGMTFLAMMICSYPMSILMGTIGRRGGFIIGMSTALIGCLLISYSISTQNFIFYCASAFFMGCGMSCGQYLRFAAVEVAGKLYKGKAISYVLAGGIVAAFLGPNLARYSRDWLQTEFSGTYLTAACVLAIVVIILCFVRFPDVIKKDSSSGAVAIRKIIIRPTFIVAVLCAITAYASMNLIMTATPLSMQHHGHEFSKAALVIQWHILGMFIPSLFTGLLIEKIGLLPMMICGCVLILASNVCNLLGTNYGHYVLALILLGVGWNFLYVGATQLLTYAYDESEKAKAQGLNDMSVAAFVASSALTSGWLLSHFGWLFMNKFVLVAVTFTLLMLIVYRISRFSPG